MDLRRKYVNDLIHGNSYYVHVNWDINGKQMNYTSYFVGFFENYYFRTHGTVIIFSDLDGHQRHIYCFNEFYSTRFPPLSPQLLTQIQRNSIMPSNGLETLITYMNLANKNPTIPHGDFLKYLNKF
jgi:hypothetical protein